MVYLNDSVAKETKILSYVPVTIVYSYLECPTEILSLNPLVMTAMGTDGHHDRIKSWVNHKAGRHLPTWAECIWGVPHGGALPIRYTFI